MNLIDEFGVTIQKLNSECTLPEQHLVEDLAENTYPIDEWFRFKMGPHGDFLGAINNMELQGRGMPIVRRMEVGDVVVCGKVVEDYFDVLHTVLVLTPEHCEEFTHLTTELGGTSVLTKNVDGSWSPTHVDDGTSAVDQEMFRNFRLFFDFKGDNALLDVLFPDYAL